MSYNGEFDPARFNNLLASLPAQFERRTAENKIKIRERHQLETNIAALWQNGCDLIDKYKVIDTPTVLIQTRRFRFDIPGGGPILITLGKVTYMEDDVTKGTVDCVVGRFPDDKLITYLFSLYSHVAYTGYNGFWLDDPITKPEQLTPINDMITAIRLKCEKRPRIKPQTLSR